MAQIADITVKSSANADVPFYAITGAAGEAPALWRRRVTGLPNGSQAYFEAKQKSNRDGTVRRVEWKMVTPVLDINGVITNRLIANGVVYIPQNASPTEVKEFPYHLAGILSNPQMLQAFESGFLPT
jgi:hypothetical protein